MWLEEEIGFAESADEPHEGISLPLLLWPLCSLRLTPFCYPKKEFFIAYYICIPLVLRARPHAEPFYKD